MQQRKKPEVDVIQDILHAAVKAFPNSKFVNSLNFQYQDRGGLSKKQLEGLYNKVENLKTIPPGKLATLEAVILKKPTKFKSAPPPPKPLYKKDDNAGALIDAILSKFPEHKRVLFLKMKFDNNEPLTPNEITELEKFYKVAYKTTT